VLVVMPANMNIETASTASPALIGVAGPKRSASLPEIGAITAITIVVGRNLTPASSAL
jgi:hypothetical protein